MWQVFRTIFGTWQALYNSQVVVVVKNPSASAGDTGDMVLSLGREDPLGESMATHCSVLAWRIPWTEKPGGLQCLGLQRVGHD